MSPWARIGAIFASAVAAALFLKLLPPVLVLVFFVGGVTAVNLTLKSRVRRFHEIGAVAVPEPTGLRRQARDPFGLLGYPLALFGRGEQGRIDEVSWGSWRGLEIRGFAYSLVPVGGGERVHLSCALTPVTGRFPRLVLEPGSFATLLGEVGIASVEAAPEELDGRYQVRCEDARFAQMLVDMSMARWLRALEDPWGFEVSGTLAVVYGPAMTRETEVLERLQGFLEHVPPAVLESHGPEPGAPEPGVPEPGGARG